MNDKKFHADNFAHRPLGMRLAMLARLWRTVIDHALIETGLNAEQMDRFDAITRRPRSSDN